MTEIVIIKSEDVIEKTEEEQDIYLKRIKKEIDLPDGLVELLKNDKPSPKFDIPALNVLKLKRLMEYENIIYICEEMPDVDYEIERTPIAMGGRAKPSKHFSRAHALDTKHHKHPPRGNVHDAKRHEHERALHDSKSHAEGMEMPLNKMVVYKKDLDYYLAGDNNYRYQCSAGEQVKIIGIVVDSKMPIKKWKWDEQPISLAFVYDFIYKTRNLDYVYNKLWQSTILENLANNLAFMKTTKSGRYYVSFSSEQHAAVVLTCLMQLYHTLISCRIIDFLNYIMDAARKMPKSSKYMPATQVLVDQFVKFGTYTETVSVDTCKADKMCALLNKHSYMFGGIFDNKFPNSIDMDMKNFNRFNFYMNLKYDGEAKFDWCDEIARKFISDKEVRKFNELYTEEIIYRNLYRRFIDEENYFRIYKKIQNFYSGSPIKNIFYSIKRYITDKERQILDFQYKKYKEQTLDVYPWSKYMVLLRSERGSPREPLAKLDEFIKKRDDSDWYRGMKGEPIICPHFYKLMRGENIQLITNEFTDTSISDNLYYCYICGEVISKKVYRIQVSSEGDVNATMLNADLEVIKFIYGYAIGISKNEIVFKMEITEKQQINLARTVTRTVLGIVKDVIHQLSVDKISSNDQKDAKKKLFTVITIYAFLIKLVFDNFETIKFKFFGKFGNKYRSDELVRYVSNIIISRQNVLINAIHGINSTNIQSFVNKAFVDISKLVLSAKLEKHKTKEYDGSQFDIIYQYFKRVMGKQKFDPDFKHVLAYQNVKFPTAKVVKDDYSFENYMHITFNSFTEYVKLPFNVPFYVGDSGNYTPKYGEFMKDFAPVVAYDREYFRVNSLQKNKQFFSVKLNHDINFHPSTDQKYLETLVAINYGIINKFHKHKWHVLEDDDKECTICKKKFSVIVQTYTPELGKNVKRYGMIDNFYNFYFNQCMAYTPNSKLSLYHVWVGDKCKQCGVLKDDITNKNYDIFLKYYEQFMKVLGNNHRKLLPFKEAIEFKRPVQEKLKRHEDAFKIFISASKSYMNGSKLDIAPAHIKTISQYENFWRNVGVFELNIFDNVLNGVKVVEDNIMRKNYLVYYVQLMKKKIVAIKNFKKITFSDEESKILLKDNIIDLKKFEMPRMEYYGGSPLGEQISYLLAYLYNLMTRAIDAAKNDEFTFYLVNVIVQNERAISPATEKEQLKIKGDQVEIFEEAESPFDGPDVYKNIDYSGENDDV